MGGWQALLRTARFLLLIDVVYVTEKHWVLLEHLGHYLVPIASPLQFVKLLEAGLDVIFCHASRPQLLWITLKRMKMLPVQLDELLIVLLVHHVDHELEADNIGIISPLLDGSLRQHRLSHAEPDLVICFLEMLDRGSQVSFGQLRIDAYLECIPDVLSTLFVRQLLLLLLDVSLLIGVVGSHQLKNLLDEVLGIALECLYPIRDHEHAFDPILLALIVV